MSAASAHRVRRHAGFTFVEVTITLAVLTLLALVVERTMAAARTTEQQFEAMRRATERSEKVTYEILGEIGESRRLFGGDAIGQDYLAALDLSRDPVIPGARLPILVESDELAPDAPGEPRTGNVLLFAVETDAAPVVVDRNSATLRHIDMYRFVCIYPRRTDRLLVIDDNRRRATDLVIWRSVRFPNWAQITSIPDEAKQRAVVTDLARRFGCEHAWDPSGAAGRAFYTLSATGTMSATPLVTPRIEEDLDLSDRGRLVYADCQLSPTAAGAYHRRSIYTVDDPADWTPGGLEVKIVGTSSARRVWIHVVVETQAAMNVLGVHASTVLARTRDL